MSNSRKMETMGYIALSVGISTLIIFTALPYYCLTAIAVPGWNIYWDYAYVHIGMLILFPTLSFLGALSTIKKRKSFEDVFLNVSVPMIVLLFLKVIQYHAVLVAVIMLLAVIIFCYTGHRIYSQNKKILSPPKKRRLLYYRCRRRMVYLFLFTLAPLAIWVGYQEGEQGDEYLAVFQSLESERAHEGENIDLDLDIASEEQWQQLSAEEKFVEVSKLVDYECAKLNVGSMDVFAVKDNMNGRLAYYDCETEKVCFNIAYLQNSATLVDAIHIVAHECYHRYTDKVVESLDYLESANMNYEALEYFQDAIVLRDAYNNYYIDHLSEETYRQNELEVRADKYAETETELLKKELGL